MFKKALLQTDLTPSQAEILEYLYQNKEAKASTIAGQIKRSRAIVYKEIEELAKIGLVEKIEKPNQISIFTAGHPSLLQKLIDKKEAQLKKDRELLNNFLPDILSSYNLNHSRPGIKFYEGLEGIEKVYTDILQTKKDIMLIRSVYDDDIPELDELVKKQIKNQVKMGIHVKAITPLAEETPSMIFNYDKDNFVERRIVPREKLTLAAQVIIYPEKVAISSLKTDIVTTLIENQEIYQSFKVIFGYLWELATPEHERIQKSLEQ
jgi:HTH-type transcriptional regulator, sugar sensing transcriptional regulator